LSIDTFHMLTSKSKTFTPAKLVDWGEVELEMAFDPSVSPPINAAASECVITFADSAASVWTFKAFLTNYRPQAPLEDRMTAQVTLKVTGHPAEIVA